MDSCERINAIFNNNETDRIGVFDFFTSEVIQRWHKEGLSENVDIEEYFDLDFRIFGFGQRTSLNINQYEPKFLLGFPTIENILNGYKLAKQNRRFLCFSFIGPFEWARIFKKDTFELLCDMKKRTASIKDLFSKCVDSIIDFHQLLEDKGYDFDGIWIWEDLGYKDGLLLSSQLYEDVLFPYHKKLCNYFSSLNKPIIFHSDGNILSIIQLLIDVGVKAIHPLENYLEKKEDKLINKFSKDTIFFRDIDLDGSIPNGKFIYSTPFPIMSDVSFNRYRQKLEKIKGLNYVYSNFKR